MAAVTDTIKSILATRDEKNALGVANVIDLLIEVRRQIVAELAIAGAGSFEAYHLDAVLKRIEQLLTTWQNGAAAELGRQLGESWQAGGTLVSQAARAGELSVGTPYLTTTTLDALKDFTFGRIKSVSDDLYNKIRGELSLGILGQKTPAQIAAEIAVDIKDKPLPLNRWGNPWFKSAAERAEVITGLEMGRAFSLATDISITQASATVPELRGMWLHAGHPRVGRAIHLALHGSVRVAGKPFYQAPNGYGVKFPRDPGAPVSEVIRCGCILIPYHPDWGPADEFAADFDIKQITLWKGGRL